MAFLDGKHNIRVILQTLVTDLKIQKHYEILISYYEVQCELAIRHSIGYRI